MTLKDIQNAISISTDVYFYTAHTKADAINGYKKYMFIFNKYTKLSDDFAKMDVAYIYPTNKDDLEVCAFESEV